MSDNNWIKTDKSFQDKYEDFKSKNKKFAERFDSYDKFADSLIGGSEEQKKIEEQNNSESENKDNKEKK